MTTAELATGKPTVSVGRLVSPVLVLRGRGPIVVRLREHLVGAVQRFPLPPRPTG